MLLLRAQGGPAPGSGHVMRCLALAEAWADRGGAASFILDRQAGALAGRVKEEGFPVEFAPGASGREDDVAGTVESARRSGARWVALDGYDFGIGFQEALRGAGLRVLCIDDFARLPRYAADVLLDQNVASSRRKYRSVAPGARRLVGPRGVLLRREFTARPRPAPKDGSVRRVLVTMGGSDPDDVTSVALAALDQVAAPGLDATVVVGGANPRLAAVRAAAAGSRNRVEVIHAARDMRDVMERADLAVSSSGTTAYELAFMGVPALLVASAGNQRLVGEGMAAAGASVYLGPSGGLGAERLAGEIGALLADGARLRSMSERGQALVDGLGAARVADALLHGPLGIRPATEADARLLWEWANEPGTRAQSFRTAPIPWETHLAWLSGKLHGSGCLLLIVVAEESGPVAQVRFDVRGDAATVSVSVDVRWRGQGLGEAAIELGSRECFSRTKVRRIYAFTRPENVASLRAFVAAGYREAGESEVEGVRARRLELVEEANDG